MVSVSRRRTNKAKETQNATEDLDHEDLDEKLRVRGICDRGIRASNTNRYTTHQIAQADGDTCPKQGET